MGAGGQHRARTDRAVPASRRRPCRRHRVRRAVHAAGRSGDRKAQASRGADRDMKFRRRSSRLPRAPWPNGIERTEPLRGQLWTRSEKALKPPDVHWAWRLLAVAAAGMEIALVVWLWLGPAFALRSVQVTGSRHLTVSQVEAAAGISSNGSVLSIDGEAAQARLLNQVWIRSATVETEL